MADRRWYPFNAVPDDYGGLLPAAFEVTTKLRKTRFSEGWTGLTVRVYSGLEGFGDFLSSGPMPPILQRSALDTLKHVLSECAHVPIQIGEFMKSNGKPMKRPPTLELFAVDPPILSGALDLQRSKIEYYESAPESVLDIDTFIFRGHEVARSPIFRLAEQPMRAIVSEAFREAVEKHKLTGLSFHPLNATWEP